MEKRVRSPNYPALSLRDAIDKVTVLYRNQHTHAAPREMVAKGMGYNSLNGASATAISALHKYGLLERMGDELRVSERALRILHPHAPDERRDAIRQAAAEPQLFSELAERFPGRLPNEELLRNWLLRKGFAPSAASSVVLAYRETADLVDAESTGYDARGEHAPESAHMHAAQPSQQVPPQVSPAAQTLADERPLGRYDFEGGGYVRVVAGGDVETEVALDMIDTLIKLKRAELVARKKGVSDPGTNANLDDAKDEGENDMFA